MTFAAGTLIGPYEITGLLGVGGMGEVYRATDPNLKRQVAIKVLPASVASDAARLARFRREAEILAALNHPNIAHVYGLERQEGRDGREPTFAIVMELVEGSTVADRIANGALPFDEALPIANQITEALEAAHEQGIVHRDLKPSNIKVRHDGVVKVLDFGLAKGLDPAGATSPGVTRSPTITSPAMTGIGVLLGTASYMSPEQARGRPVDTRSDIWAFGAVLYEMLTGRRAFPGDDVSDVLASVLAREPDWTLLPAQLSPVLVACIKRCLHKDRKQRIRDIGDVWLALNGAFDVAPAHVVAVSQPRWQRILPAAAMAILAVMTGAAVAWMLRPAIEPRTTTRFDYELPASQQLAVTQRPVIATSPDGRSFLYHTTDGLYLRSMGDLAARLITGTNESFTSPFFSPDGQWVAYFGQGGTEPVGDGVLKKIPIGGGAPLIICATTVPFGATWAPDNTILFGQRAGIMRVSANGGTPQLIVRAAEGEQVYGPQLLPDRDSLLFSVTRDAGPARWDQAQVVVQSLTTGTRTVLVASGSDVRYLPSGHLVYAWRDGLFAVAFDPARTKVTSGAVPLVQGVRRPIGVNAAASNYAVSDEGTLTYVAETVSLHSLVWLNRDGTPAGSLSSIPAGTYEEPRLSPDGTRVLVTRDGDIWMYDVASGRSNRLTRDGSSQMAVWAPTGARIAYASARKGNLEAWVAAADGSGEPQQLTQLGGQVHVDSWSPDGAVLAIHHHPPSGAVAIFMVPMDPRPGRPEKFATGDFNAEGADFSRDGRYVAYLSTDSGQREISIRPYPGPGGQTSVSVGGGREPVWVDSGELFYRNSSGEKFFAVSIKTQPSLQIGRPVPLFQGPYFVARSGSPRAQYDVTPDGQRFLVVAPSSSSDAAAGRPHIIVVQNWVDELKRRVPTR